MSTLRTFNLQNPDSGTVNIEMDQGGNTLMTGIATVRGAAHFTSTSGSDAVGIGTDITAYKLDVRVTGAEAGLRVYNPDTSSNASGILRLGNDDNQNSAFLKLNGANNSSTVGGAANLVLGTGTARQVHLATNGTSRLAVRSDGKISAGTALDVNNGYEFSIRGADGTGCLYAHGRNHYLSTRSTSHASLTLKKSNSDSDGIDYLQLRDSSNTGKFIINGDGTLQIVDSIKHMGDTDTSISFPANDTITLRTSGSERLRITSGGDLLLGGHSAYTYDDTGDTNVILDIYGGATLNKRGILSLSGRTSTADLDLGSIWFNNHDNNSGSSTGNTMKLASAIQSRAVTSDNNAQNDSGGYLQFYTKPESGPLAERVRITSGGHLVIGSGYADFQSGTRGEAGSTDPYKLVFQNQYSTGYTDEKLKLYLFNSGNTRQGFGPGPSYDLQYHCSGGAADQSRHSFYTDNVLRMQIHDANGITKPTQPGFYARRTTAGDGRAAGSITEWHISGTGSYNEGSHFKTSGADQGKFVAPVSGKYYFAAQPGYKQTNNDFQFYFRINGTIISEPVRVIDGGDDLTSHSAFTGTCIVHMNTGQKFDVYVGNTHHVNTTFNFFCGYLLG